jgi:hypothetical protein
LTYLLLSCHAARHILFDAVLDSEAPD